MANPVEPQFPLAQEPGNASPLELPEMEKLLTKVEDKDDKTLKLSKSLSGTLNLEQNGHRLPFKMVSEQHLEVQLSQSPSRVSSRWASSISTASYAQEEEVPNDYLILAIASCFCPVWPLNLIPLIFSIMSRGSVQQGDLDGARRLGHLARLLSITFIILGIVIIIVAVTVNFTETEGKARLKRQVCKRVGGSGSGGITTCPRGRGLDTVATLLQAVETGRTNGTPARSCAGPPGLLPVAR
ncbi:trafficking regulator of GLUT4 1 [Trichechus inunguis]